MTSQPPTPQPPKPPASLSPAPDLQHIQRTGDGSLTLHSPRFGQSYGSRHGAAEQARVVFAEGSGVAEAKYGRVLEIGFGIGQNLRATLAARPSQPLDYVAYEFDPVSAEVLSQVSGSAELGTVESSAAEGTAHPLWTALLEAWPAWAAETAAVLDVTHGPQRLRIVRGDALQAASRGDFTPAWAEAIYLDGFSPDANPELWSPQFLAQLARALAPAGALVTYSSAGHVRRALTAAGLVVHKRAGPTGKREVIRAEWAANADD